MRKVQQNPVVTIQRHVRGFLVRRRLAKANARFQELFEDIETKDELSWRGADFRYPAFSRKYERTLERYLEVLEKLN